MKRRKEWVDELNIMLRLKKKAEIQARRFDLNICKRGAGFARLGSLSSPLSSLSLADIAQALSSFGFQ